MHKARERGEPAQKIVERLVALDRLRERAPCAGPLRQACELAPKILLERDRILIRPIEIAFHRRVVDAGVEIGEIPFGQRAEFWRACGCGFRGDAYGGAFLCGHEFTLVRRSDFPFMAHGRPVYGAW